MSEEKDKNQKKKKKTTKIIAGIVGSAALIGGATAAGIITLTEPETNREENEKENEKKGKGSKSKNLSIDSTVGSASSNKKTDISGKTIPNVNIYLGKLPENTVKVLKDKFKGQLNNFNGLTELSIDDFNIYQANTKNKEIKDNDIENNEFLNIKIVIKETSSHFTGYKDNIKLWYIKSEKKDLKDEFLRRFNFNYSFSKDKTNNEFNEEIYSNNFLWMNEKNQSIKYFSDEQGTIDVSNEKQKAGTLYVVITADNSHPKYKGSTKLLKITVKNHDLSSIDLTKLTYKVNRSSVFNGLKESIKKESKIKDIAPINDFLLSIKEENGSAVDTGNIQRLGKFKLQIKSEQEDAQWAGETKIINLELVE